MHLIGQMQRGDPHTFLVQATGIGLTLVTQRVMPGSDHQCRRHAGETGRPQR